MWRSPCSSRFLSTPSARRATGELNYEAAGSVISIHALREEGDRLLYAMISAVDLFLSTPSARRATCAALAGSSFVTYFYPRPPRGGRLCRGQILGFLNHFYPRPPRGGRRCYQGTLGNVRKISIHALREEGDLGTIHAGIQCFDFYPRPPRGGRRPRYRAPV